MPRLWLDKCNVFTYVNNYCVIIIKVVFYWDQPFLVGSVGWVFSCSIGEKPFSIGLVDHLFQPALSLVETVENDG